MVSLWTLATWLRVTFISTSPFLVCTWIKCVSTLLSNFFSGLLEIPSYGLALLILLYWGRRVPYYRYNTLFLLLFELLKLIVAGYFMFYFHLVYFSSFHICVLSCCFYSRACFPCTCSSYSSSHFFLKSSSCPSSYIFFSCFFPFWSCYEPCPQLHASVWSVPPLHLPRPRRTQQYCHGHCSLWWVKDHEMYIHIHTSGKMCITFSFAVIFILCAEIFPTEVRNSGIGSASFVGR